MLRIDCLRSVYEHLQDCLVVTIMGATAAELQSLGHRENFFYLQHSMGLASSLGLGLALCLPDQRVVVFDGDGSVLMNLGGLTTVARYAPQNLVHVVFDNESLFSTGGFPTATRTGTDLTGIAHAAGIREVQTVRTWMNSDWLLTTRCTATGSFSSQPRWKHLVQSNMHPACHYWKIAFSSSGTYKRELPSPANWSRSVVHSFASSNR